MFCDKCWNILIIIVVMRLPVYIADSKRSIETRSWNVNK